MFSGQFKNIEKSEDNSYFFDRDGTHFHHLLNWMRSEKIPQISVEIRNDLIREARFYRLDNFVQLFEEQATNSNNNGIPSPEQKKRKRDDIKEGNPS